MASSMIDNDALYKLAVEMKEDKSQLVSIVYRILDSLAAQDMSYVARVPPPNMGIHPDNRSKWGVSGTDAQTHGRDILDVGFSWKKAADATCTEVPPDSAEAKRHNEENVTLSSGLIPPLLAMKCLSIGGGHTNTFLRQVLAGVRCVVARLQDDRGNLSYDKLTQGRPEFKRALDEGLEWFIIHWPCEQIWPDLVRLVQSALKKCCPVSPEVSFTTEET